MLACMASASILFAGFIVGTYCVQLRGPGLAELLANGRLPELVLVGGGVAALAVVVHLSVLRTLAASRGPSSVRGLLRRALELLDSPDGEASEAYAALPAEVRDLIGMFEAQRTREQQVEREMQRLREEMQDLVQRLEHCGAALAPLHVPGAGEFTTRVAQVWNQVVVQVRQARGATGATASPVPPMEASAAPPMPATVPRFADWAAAADASAPEPSAAVARRLEELEMRLSTLQEEMRTLQSIGAAAAPAATVPLFAAEGPPAGSPPLAPESPSEPLSLLQDPMLLEPETDGEEVQAAADAGMTWTDIVPTAVPWTGPAPGAPAFDLELPDALARDEEAPTPAPTPEEELRHARSEVLQPTQSTKASDSGYFEWTGGSTLRGSWKLRDEATQELTRAEETPTPAPQAPVPGTASSSAVPARTPVSQSFETHFPHFVGKPVGELEGRVAVSFEGNSTAPAPGRRAATSGLESPGSEPPRAGTARRPWSAKEFDT